MHNYKTIFKSLLKKGADVSIYDKNKDTVLHYLIKKENLHLLT